MTREPNALLRVHVDEGGHLWADDRACGRVLLSRISGLLLPNPDDLLPLPEDWDCDMGCPYGCLACEGAGSCRCDEHGPQPCTLGCTRPCGGCGGTGREMIDHPVRHESYCEGCTGGTVPAVHASEDECRPPLPEGWPEPVLTHSGRRPYPWHWRIDQPIAPGLVLNRRSGSEASEAERDRALWAAVRDIVRQTKEERS